MAFPARVRSHQRMRAEDKDVSPPHDLAPVAFTALGLRPLAGNIQRELRIRLQQKNSSKELSSSVSVNSS